MKSKKSTKQANHTETSTKNKNLSIRGKGRASIGSNGLKSSKQKIDSHYLSTGSVEAHVTVEKKSNKQLNNSYSSHVTSGISTTSKGASPQCISVQTKYYNRKRDKTNQHCVSHHINNDEVEFENNSNKLGTFEDFKPSPSLFMQNTNIIQSDVTNENVSKQQVKNKKKKKTKNVTGPIKKRNIQSSQMVPSQDVYADQNLLRKPSLTNIAATCDLNSALQGIAASETSVKDVDDLCIEHESVQNINIIQSDVTNANVSSKVAKNRKKRKANNFTEPSVKENIQTSQKRHSKDFDADQIKKQKMNQKQLRPLSLTNIGATCYLNSAFQGISACKAFIKDINDLCFEHQDSEVKLLPVFKRLIDVLHGCSNDEINISRNDVFSNWNKTGHQDSYELLAHVMNQVYNELRQYKEKVGKIPHRDLQRWLEEKLPMRVIMLYKIECGCKAVSYSPLQSDLALHISIPRNKEVSNLGKLIDSYFDDDVIEDYVCDRADCTGINAKRMIRLCQPLPHTLCIHLQRTYWDFDHMKKIDKHVPFEKELVLKSNYCSRNDNCRNYDSNNFKDDNETWSTKCKSTESDWTYHLTSAIVHYGTVECGHYVCYKKFDDGWFLADDNRVEYVTETAVLNCQAYILFYEQFCGNNN